MDPQLLQQTNETLKWLLTIAWLLPLVGFVVEILLGGFFWGTKSKNAAYFAVFCIATGFVCSLAALITWGQATGWSALADRGHDTHAASSAEPGHAPEAHGHDAAHTDEHPAAAHKEEHAHATDAHAAQHGAADHGHAAAPIAFTGLYYRLAQFGPLDISLSYYIDSLTLVMFTMVTLIATCIHLFAMGYMSDELTDNYEDHQVHTSHGHFHRPGRFYRFFSFLSLFCFSMLGLVLAGNIFQVFIFWELVGVCSYFLIGFYVERKSASTAANKAFIMNRVGDFGFLIGLMILWTWFGTFQFGDLPGADGKPQPGLFTQVRGNDGQLLLHVNEREVTEVVLKDDHNHRIVTAAGEQKTIPYSLLVVAGLGIFAGCIGKSAQFPLQTWLPDAMEGPTPVSALVHSATMVAAGVYLTGRFYPAFLPEVLLTIAYIGCITLFVAATIAVVATDIKKVLAYSTISQLGYMMLGLGVGGWSAGLFHLVTHAFFKSLMFLASGSVIHGCHHVQEMPQMGGLWRKMPWTAGAMLVGVIAISGLAIPYSGLIFGEPIAFSGYHSKDAIVATALTFLKANGHYPLFVMPLVGAGITAFYMFRLWFYTFAGKPRDKHVYDHAHESPAIMVAPLVVLSVLAAICAVGGESGVLFKLLGNSEPVGIAAGSTAVGQMGLSLPSHAAIHANHNQAGTLALAVAALGAFTAYVLYGARWVNPADVHSQFKGLHGFLANKWGFDDLYDTLFVKPTHVVASWCSSIDKCVFDGILHGSAKITLVVSNWDRKFDETIVDGLVNAVGNWTYGFGRSLRVVQTGQMRNYVMFIAVGLLGMFVLLIMFFPS